MANDHHIPTSEPSDRSVPWTPADVGIAVTIAIVFILLLAALNVGLDQFGLAIDPSITVNVGTLFFLGLTWYFTIFKYNAQWSDLGLRPFRQAEVGLGCGFMIVFFLFNALYASLLGIFGLQVQPDITPAFEQSFFPLGILFGGMILAPLIEEIFFRGFVFAALRKEWGWVPGVWGSAALFAVAHIIPTSFIPIFLLGALFAYLYQLSGSIWPAIIMHAVTNSMALIAAYSIWRGWLPPLDSIEGQTEIFINLFLPW